MQAIQSQPFTIDSGELSFFPFVAGEQRFEIHVAEYAYAQVTAQQQQLTLLLPTSVLEQMTFSETEEHEIFWTNADNVSSNYFNKQITVEADEFEVPYLDHAVMSAERAHGQKICLLPSTEREIRLDKAFAIACSEFSEGDIHVYSTSSFIFTNLTNHVLGFGFVSDVAQSQEAFRAVTNLILEELNDED